MLTRITTSDGGVLEVMGTIEATEELNDDGSPIVVQAAAGMAPDEMASMLADHEKRIAAMEGHAKQAAADAAEARQAAAALLRDAAAHRGLDDVELDEPVAVAV